MWHKSEQFFNACIFSAWSSSATIQIYTIHTIEVIDSKTLCVYIYFFLSLISSASNSKRYRVNSSNRNRTRTKLMRTSAQYTVAARFLSLSACTCVFLSNQNTTPFNICTKVYKTHYQKCWWCSIFTIRIETLNEKNVSDWTINKKVSEPDFTSYRFFFSIEYDAHAISLNGRINIAHAGIINVIKANRERTRERERERQKEIAQTIKIKRHDNC